MEDTARGSEQDPDAATGSPLRVFCAYSHKDEQFLDGLHEHLSLQRRLGRIAVWHDRRIDAGDEWKNEIDERIETYPVILLLISASFLNSEYCYGTELGIAMRRHDNKEARVIPIILRPCDWKEAPFAKLQALPRNGRPVVRWEDRDEAWLDVVTGIRKVIESLGKRQSSEIRAPTTAETEVPETPAPVLATAIVKARPSLSVQPVRHEGIGEEQRLRKACLVLENWESRGTQEATKFTLYFRNEGEWSAFDVRVVHNVSTIPPERPVSIVCPRLDPIQMGERRRRQTGPARCAYSFTIPAPERNPTGEVREGQEHIIYLRLAFRDGLDEEDDAIYVMRLTPDGAHWNAKEDRSQALLSRLCRRVRPEARDIPAPERNTAAFSEATTSESPSDGPAELVVLLAALRRVLRTGNTLISSRDLVMDPGIAPHGQPAITRSVQALARQAWATMVQDLGPVLGCQFRLTPEGIDAGLPIVVPNLDELADRIRRVICDVRSTTSKELTHTGISQLLVEHVALGFERRGLVRTRRDADGTMEIDNPSSELCPAAPPAPRPKNLTADEHKTMRELVRRAAMYPEVFRPSILSWRAGDGKQGYQSDHITGTTAPDDARAMLTHDRDFTPSLVRDGFLMQEASDKLVIDELLFHAYGFEPPS